MTRVVITGTGLYRPPHIITNAELVEAFNAYAEAFNQANAARIDAGEVEAKVSSSVESTYTVNTTGETLFYLGQVELSHSKKPSWERVTGLFLATVTLDTDDDGNPGIPPTTTSGSSISRISSITGGTMTTMGAS